MVEANADNNFSTALDFYNQNNFREAKRLCSDILSDYPNYIPSLHLTGRILVEQGRFALAVDAFRKAVLLDPKYTGLLVELGEALVKDFRFSEAIPIYQRALTLLGEDWKVLEKLADAQLALGQICEAIESLGLCYIAGVGDAFTAAMQPSHQRPEVAAVKERVNLLLKTAELIGVCSFKKVHGWFVPRSDVTIGKAFVNAPEYNGRPVFDFEHINTCVNKTRQRRLALDIGANIGCWSWVLSDLFEKVLAFEPIPMMQQSFIRNIVKDNVTLNKFALGETSGFAEMAYIDIMCGASFITSTGLSGEHTPNSNSDRFIIKRLDDFNLTNVDFMKVDTEGFELFVIKGGLETIMRCKPIIYIEQVWGNRYVGSAQHDAVRLLIGLGAHATPLGDGTNFLVEWP